MKVVVIGATGGSGRAAVDALLAAGREVTAFARHPERIHLARAASGPASHSGRLRLVQGDALSPSDVLRAVSGQDAVVVTLGITENPLRVRLIGAGRTQDDVRSVGTRNVVDAMRARGVRRLVVQT